MACDVFDPFPLQVLLVEIFSTDVNLEDGCCSTGLSKNAGYTPN